MKLDFSGQIFRKIPKCQFHGNPVRSELFHADGQTDMTKLIVTFRHSAIAPNNDVHFYEFSPTSCYFLFVRFKHCAVFKPLGLCSTKFVTSNIIVLNKPASICRFLYLR
jgi:hypothetical protein